ncbi:MAG: tetratricopeptide repeat protein [candidate division Zixibacteria bacterium]|nr:tetratricopeptide repeat protein [candidate division Zixibacteria bacterium]
MYNKVKLTKRQIKEDKFMAFMLTSKQQVTDNWQFVVIGAIVLILVLVGAVYYSNSQALKAAEGVARYDQAVSEYRSGSNQVALLNFSQIVEEHSGELIAERSTLMMGKINYELRNYSEAIRFFEMYLSSYSGDLLNRSVAYAGIAGSHENNGEYQQAGEKFIVAYQENIDGPLAGDYLVAAVRNYLEAGNTAGASDQIDILEEKFTGTIPAIAARRLFSEKTGG